MSEPSIAAGEVQAVLGHLDPLLAGRHVLVVGPDDERPLTEERILALRAQLAPGGLLAVALRPGEAAAVPILRALFPVVESAGVLPLRAWAVVPEGAPPGDVTWDGRGLGAALPAVRLLLCGERPSGLRGATVVALPADPGAGSGLEGAAAIERAEAREAELAAEVLALSWRTGELTRELAAAVAERDTLRAARDRAPAPIPDLPDLLSP